MTSTLSNGITLEWVVNEFGELGVAVSHPQAESIAFAFMYKGEALEYTAYSDSAKVYRPVGKREFGESGPVTDWPAEEHDWYQMNLLPVEN